MSPTSHRFDAGGVTLAVHEWGGDAGPALLLCHATGFHGVVWQPVAERLVARGHRVYSFDFRGHGDSDAPDAAYHWDDFGRDVLAVVDDLGIAGDAVGVGHSKGSAALVIAESERPGTFRRLWLYEPIIFPSDPPIGPQANALSERARRRRLVFSSPEEAFDNFAGKPPLDVLAPEALRAYVEHGLRPRDDGSWELKCKGEVEARVYEMGSAHEGFRRLAAVGCPAVVVCGEHSDAIPPSFGQLHVDRLTNGRLEVAEGLGHFGPLENPDAAVASIERLLAEP